jgi:hypothetical protein
VLYACGEVNEENFRLSDETCAALQMANFWQDVRVDWTKDRVYFPQEDMRRFGVTDETIAAGIATPEFRALMRHEVETTRAMFARGLPLIGRVQRDLALDLDLFSRGGLEILRAIERRDFDVLSARPRLPGHKMQRRAASSAARCCHSGGSARARQRRRLDSGNRSARTRPGGSVRRVPGNRQARSEEFLLLVCRLARAAAQRYLRHLCLHAQGRRSLRR